MKIKRLLLTDIKTPLRLKCPMCFYENIYMPGTPYLHCRNCDYVYAWTQGKELVIEDDLEGIKKKIV